MGYYTYQKLVTLVGNCIQNSLIGGCFSKIKSDIENLYLIYSSYNVDSLTWYPQYLNTNQ